jgi:hypothetical protein
MSGKSPQAPISARLLLPAHKIVGACPCKRLRIVMCNKYLSPAGAGSYNMPENMLVFYDRSSGGRHSSEQLRFVRILSCQSYGWYHERSNF